MRQAKIFYSAPSSVTYRTFTVSSPEGEHECLRLGTQGHFVKEFNMQNVLGILVTSDDDLIVYDAYLSFNLSRFVNASIAGNLAAILQVEPDFEL